MNTAYLKQLCHAAVGVDFDDKQLYKCEICVEGKLTNKPFRTSDNRAAKLLQLFCDNKASIDLCENSRFSSRTKHIDVRHQFIRDAIGRKQIQVSFVPSTNMLADALTKATGNNKLKEFVDSVGLKSTNKKEDKKKED